MFELPDPCIQDLDRNYEPSNRKPDSLSAINYIEQEMNFARCESTTSLTMELKIHAFKFQKL